MNIDVLYVNDLMDELDDYKGELELLTDRMEDASTEDEKDEIQREIDKIEIDIRYQDLLQLEKDLEDDGISWDSYMVNKDDFEFYVEENLDKFFNGNRGLIDIPDEIMEYINFEKMAKDIEMDLPEIDFNGESYNIVEE